MKKKVKDLYKDYSQGRSPERMEKKYKEVGVIMTIGFLLCILIIIIELFS